MTKPGELLQYNSVLQRHLTGLLGAPSMARRDPKFKQPQAG